MTTHASDQAPRRRRLFAQADTPESPQGGIANPMTFLLLAILAAFFWWSMRRRRMQEERFREQRRQETVTHAEESARNIAHIMRQAPTRASAEAAAAEGLAAAARVPEQPVTAMPEPGPDLTSDNGTAEIEIAEREMLGGREAAAARAERAAESEAADAARRADLEGPSEERRIEAGLAAAAEAAADTVDIQRVEIIDPLDASEEQAALVDPIDAADIVPAEVDLVKEDAPLDPDEASRVALRAGLAALEAEAAVNVPFGAVAGDGSLTCPADYPIKGNRQSLIYHEPGQSSYAATIPEFCFASGEAAEAAGYRQSRARGGSKHE
ncbi:MAG: hypothetical protein M3Z20_17030 [Chloroflexota bacterium]|nr:hypothetical protein [Chloroflexota bacterium]